MLFNGGLMAINGGLIGSNGNSNGIWLVGFLPTPLKNHGLKVSWDDEHVPICGKS